VGAIARSIRLHDRISDVFRIRLRFDVDYLLLPLARDSGANVGALSMAKLRKERGRLMAKTFYKYASSTDPVIDKHLIYQALDWWSWYWVLVEAVAVFLPTGVSLLFLGINAGMGHAWGLRVCYPCDAILSKSQHRDSTERSRCKS